MSPRRSITLMVIAIGRQRAYLFIVFQTVQNWVAAEQIGFKLVAVLDVRK
jgi:hypothetical protein